MKESKHKPVQVVLTYNSSNPAKNTLRAKIVPGPVDEKLNASQKFDDKLIRRYSLDDNGGGYLGL